LLSLSAVDCLCRRGGFQKKAFRRLRQFYRRDFNVSSLLFQVDNRIGGSSSSRPNEFIVAFQKLVKDGNVKGAKRRGVPRGPLIFLAFASIVRQR